MSPDQHLAVVLSGISIKPQIILTGFSMPQLISYLSGYARAQTLYGDPGILSGTLLDEFGRWLLEERKLEGSSWYWRVFSADSSESNVVTMLRLFDEFLSWRGTPVSKQAAEDWFAERGAWRSLTPVVGR